MENEDLLDVSVDILVSETQEESAASLTKKIIHKLNISSGGNTVTKNVTNTQNTDVLYTCYCILILFNLMHVILSL